MSRSRKKPKDSEDFQSFVKPTKKNRNKGRPRSADAWKKEDQEEEFIPPERVQVFVKRPKPRRRENVLLAPIDRTPNDEYGRRRFKKDLSEFCGGRRRGKNYNGEGFCRLPAGHGTDHPGVGRCRLHGGNTKNYNIHLVRELVAEKLRQGIYGDPVEIDPDTALLMEVHRTAGHVEWLRQRIQEIGESKGDKVLVQYTDAFGMGPSAWIQMYQQERTHLVRVAKAAIDTGLARRHVEIAQQQAQIMAMVMLGFIRDDELGLTPAQQLAAKKIMRKHLENAPLEAPELPQSDELPLIDVEGDES